MEIGTAEISRIIKEQIRDYEKTVEVQEVGSVLSTGDGIARVYGLDKVAAGELLEFPHGIFGVALNLEEDDVGELTLGVVGNADGALVAFHPDPLIILGVLEVVRKRHTSLPAPEMTKGRTPSQRAPLCP